jgi:hypothetical protein
MTTRLASPLLCSLLALSMLCGCSTTAPQTTLPRGEPVTLSVKAGAALDSPVAISNQSMGKSVGTGATSGGITGGLWGLACGPFAVLCVPIGAGLGALTGTAAGALVGATGALSEAQAVQVRDRLTQLRQSHDLVADLRGRLTEGASRHWPLTSVGPATTLTVEIEELSLASTRDDRIGFYLRVVVQVTPAGQAAKVAAPAAQRTATRGAEPEVQARTTPVPKIYDYASPMTPLSVWLDPHSDFLDTTFSTAMQQLAAQIVIELVPS